MVYGAVSEKEEYDAIFGVFPYNEEDRT